LTWAERGEANLTRFYGPVSSSLCIIKQPFAHVGGYKVDLVHLQVNFGIIVVSAQATLVLINTISSAIN